ncbi:unannotated protein [freshwater metagenome]|uniref:Unannotated protein n=1 Tax=freshwater metagenome TaxID=449393 RepID=A0A6J7J009_9ZZZZ
MSEAATNALMIQASEATELRSRATTGSAVITAVPSNATRVTNVTMPRVIARC